MSGTTRVWLLNAAMVAAGVALFVGGVRDLSAPASPFAIEWWQLAVGFCLAEIFVVHVEFRRDAHSVSLSELPLVLGLFFTSPSGLVVAQLVGAGAALLLHRRQSFLKLTFNLGHFFIEACLAVIVFRAIADTGGSPGGTEWVAAGLATLITTVFGVLVVFVAISLSEGAAQRREFPRALALGVLVTMTNTSLALIGVIVAWTNRNGVLLLIVPAATLFEAYRAYVSFREKNEGLEFLHRSTQLMHESPQVESALRALLEQARSMFRAECAEIDLVAPSAGGPHDAALRTTLGPGDEFSAMQPTEFALAPEAATTLTDDAMIAVLRGETKVLGAMTLTNRLGDVTNFDEKDLTLFETLANHVSVWLENSRLERSLVQLSELQEQLRYQALHDPLTSLANRALFTDHVQHAVARGDRHGRLLAVLFLDLDDFKAVNDSLGHGAGDALLVAVAERLRSCLRPGDTAARFGGDEFAVLLEDIESELDAVSAADRIGAALRVPFYVQNRELRVGASIGIAVRTNEHDASQMLRNSDVAMYIAKRRGKGRHEVFESSMYAAALQRHELKEDLQRAISAGDFVLHYQPIIDLASGALDGVEALVRWDSVTRGLVGPSEFIPVAEDSGMILAIGQYVLEEACRQASAWQRMLSTRTPLTINVNLSARQLSHATFVDDVADVLARTQLAPHSLVLEITETVLMEGDGVARRLAELRDLGVRLAIDDFGTGYSSLSYLRRFPIDILKMDKTFVQGVGTTANDDALAQAIIDLTHTLGLVVVAEGIERDEQRVQLRELHCNLGQGYLFTRPLDAEGIEPMILNGLREPSPA